MENWKKQYMRDMAHLCNCAPIAEGEREVEKWKKILSPEDWTEFNSRLAPYLQQ